MIRRLMLLAAAMAVSGLVVGACSAGGTSPEMSNARIAQPTGPNTAMYFTADGYGTDDRLIGATVDIATEVQVHETVMNDDGTMGMNHVGAVDLPAEGQIVLEPGGLHLMFLDVERLEVGDVVEVSLQWREAGDVKMDVEVVAPGDTGG